MRPDGVTQLYLKAVPTRLQRETPSRAKAFDDEWLLRELRKKASKWWLAASKAGWVYSKLGIEFHEESTAIAIITARASDGAWVPRRRWECLTRKKKQPGLTPGNLHRETPRWPTGFPVLADVSQFGTAWAGLQGGSENGGGFAFFWPLEGNVGAV